MNQHRPADDRPKQMDSKKMRTKVKVRIAVVGILVGGLIPPLTGAESGLSTNVTIPPPTVVPAASATPPPAPADAAEPVVIEYSNVELSAALRALANLAGVSLILGDNVTGSVTVRLEDIAYTNALKLIAESKGYAYVEDRHYKNLIKVLSKAALEAEPVDVRLVALRYAKADDLKNVLAPLLTTQGKIMVDGRANTLILSDVPSTLSKLQTVAEALDTQPPQVQIEAKFVERTRNPKKDLGVNWSSSLLDHTVGLRRADPSSAIQSPAGGTGTANPSPLEFAKNLGGGPWKFPTTIFDAGEAQVVFSFLSQDVDTELLANPRVVTTDNGNAKISISTEYPIPQFQYNQQIGALQISGFSYKDIGIILTVTPRINQDEFITLEVTPEASSQNGFATLGSGGGSSVQIPIVDSRNAKTTVLIKSGHTLAIGGMMRQDTSDSYTKVPLLGDLPGFGPLFRSKSLSKLKRDLYIFLTPTIIRAADQLMANKAVTEPPFEEVFVNDRWMPRDSARPASPKALSPSAPSLGPASCTVSTNAPAQNFGPKSP